MYVQVLTNSISVLFL